MTTRTDTAPVVIRGTEAAPSADTEIAWTAMYHDGPLEGVYQHGDDLYGFRCTHFDVGGPADRRVFTVWALPEEATIADLETRVDVSSGIDTPPDDAPCWVYRSEQGTIAELRSCTGAERDAVATDMYTSGRQSA